MENSVFYAVKSIFQQDTITALSSSTGASVAQVARALDVSIPTVLLALQAKDKQQLATIVDDARIAFGDVSQQEEGSLSFDLPQSAHKPRIDFTEKVFGDDRRNIEEALSNYLAMDSAAVHSLISACIPAVFSVITGAGTQWDSKQVNQLLDNNKADFLAAIPADLAPLVADSKMNSSASAAVPPVTIADAIIEPTYTTAAPQSEVDPPPIVHTTETVKQQKRSPGIWWLLFFVLAVALWVVFSKGCNGESQVSETVDSTATR